MGIRTPVASVRGSHDWPVYTIAAELLNKLGDVVTYSFLRVHCRAGYESIARKTGRAAPKNVQIFE